MRPDVQHQANIKLVIRDIGAGDQRTIRGVATTDTLDRVGDRISPLGATFAAKVPLLMQHDHTQPLGWVRFDKPTKAGISFTATITRIDQPGPLQRRLDDAWAAAKAGLYQFVSIGFRPIGNEVDRLPEGGLKYNRVEILELSLCSVPANPDAQVTEVKRLTHKVRLADLGSGAGPHHVVKFTQADMTRGKILAASADRRARMARINRELGINSTHKVFLNPEAKDRHERERAIIEEARQRIEERRRRAINGGGGQ